MTLQLTREIIRSHILDQWIAQEASLDVTLTRLRICDKAPSVECITVEGSADGWEGEIWLDPPKHMNSIDNLEKRLYHKGSNS